MSKNPDSKPTLSHHEANPTISHRETPPSPRPTTGPKTEKDRPGASILASTDPSTAALRRWAQDKQLQYPGQDGSFAQGGNTAGVVDGMAWGGPWLLPHKGDTLPPPDERVVHGEARVVGGEERGGGEEIPGEEGGRGRKRWSLAGLLRGKGKGKGKGGGGDVVG